MEREKYMEKTYRLMGTMNLSQEERTFVYPIFEHNGDYYFEHTFDNLHIKSFEKVDGIDHISKIERLEEKSLLKEPKTEYHINDEAILAYQEDKEHLFIGTFDEMISYYENQAQKNPFTSMVIDNMKEERARKK